MGIEEKSPFEGGRGMTSSNYRTIKITIATAEIPLQGGAGVGGNANYKTVY
jgi:hypothetical protein